MSMTRLSSGAHRPLSPHFGVTAPRTPQEGPHAEKKQDDTLSKPQKKAPSNDNHAFSQWLKSRDAYRQYLYRGDSKALTKGDTFSHRAFQKGLPPARLDKADSKALQGNYAAAISLYQKALAENPESLLALVGMGNTFHKMAETVINQEIVDTQEFKRAIRSYEKAVEIDKRQLEKGTKTKPFYPAYIGLADLYGTLGTRDEAEKAIQLYREVITSITSLANIDYPSQVEKNHRQRVESNPILLAAMNNLALLYMVQKKEDRAYPIVLTLHELQPENGRFLNNALILEYLVRRIPFEKLEKGYSQAIHLLNQEMKNNSVTPEMLSSLSTVYRNRGVVYRILSQIPQIPKKDREAFRLKSIEDVKESHRLNPAAQRYDTANLLIYLRDTTYNESRFLHSNL